MKRMRTGWLLSSRLNIDDVFFSPMTSSLVRRWPVYLLKKWIDPA